MLYLRPPALMLSCTSPPSDLDEALRISQRARHARPRHASFAHRHIEAAKATKYALRLRPGQKDGRFLQHRGLEPLVRQRRGSIHRRHRGRAGVGAASTEWLLPTRGRRRGRYARPADGRGKRARRSDDPAGRVAQRGLEPARLARDERVRQPARGLRGLRERARARRRDLLPPRPRSRDGPAAVPGHAHHHRRFRGLCGRHGRTPLHYVRDDPGGRDQPGPRPATACSTSLRRRAPVADLQLPPSASRTSRS